MRLETAQSGRRRILGAMVAAGILVGIGSSGVRHPIALEDWMARGPGVRHGRRPMVAYDRISGDELSLSVVPLAYRNDIESRALIAAGRIPSPWPPVWDTEHWGEPPCELFGPKPLRAHGAVRRLALAGRWAELESTAWPAEAAPALCDVLDSDLDVPDRGGIVDRLAQLDFAPAGDVILRQLGRFIHADRDLVSARRCLHAMGAMSGITRGALAAIALLPGWPAPIPGWAGAEIEAANGHALGEVGPDGRWVSALDIPGWDFKHGRRA
jgi:hypothetical protein